MRWTWILVVSTSLALAACGNKGDDKGDDKGGNKGDKGEASKEGSAKSSGPVGACDRREKEGMCAEYHGKAANKDWVKNECEYTKVPMLDKCPTEGAIGRCVTFEGGPSEVHAVWYAGKEAMYDLCEKSGGGKQRAP